MPSEHPLRLTPPQRVALLLFAEGWECSTAGAHPPARFGRLLWYSFWREGESQRVSGGTLASFLERGWVAWDATTLTLAYDGRSVPGYRLILTAAGQQAATVATTLQGDVCPS